MKAVIPAAGRGTRLYPQTHTKPKAMVRIAGRPILGHILSNLVPTRVEEVVIIVGGQMQDQIVSYAKRAFGDTFALKFVEQESAEGLGHSIYQAEAAVGGDPALIALGDMLFENGYDVFIDAHDNLGSPDASVGVKAVDRPSHYGVTELAPDGSVERLVEKPDDPRSNKAISGVYIIEDTSLLFDELSVLIENERRGAGGEFQLTDALQGLVDREAYVDVFEVSDWYDCGRPETLLKANRVLLEKTETDGDATLDHAVIIPPVDIGADVTVGESVVGPYVSVDDGSTIAESVVQNTIVGRGAELDGLNLSHSIIGDGATVTDHMNRLNVGDNSTIEL